MTNKHYEQIAESLEEAIVREFKEAQERFEENPLDASNRLKMDRLCKELKKLKEIDK